MSRDALVACLTAELRSVGGSDRRWSASELAP
jgi:hypothetical protein